MRESTPEDLATGLAVFTRSGQELGRVKAVEDGRFKVDRPMLPDLWLTTDAIADIRGDRIILIPGSDELGKYHPED